MTKVERIKVDLSPLVEKYLAIVDSSELEKYLLANSNLPGPRGNIELAYALSESLESYNIEDIDKLFSLFKRWASISLDLAPVTESSVMLPFCGVHAIGKIGCLYVSKKDEAIKLLKKSAVDKRWRIREAVCMALQFMLDKYPEFIIKHFEEWIKTENYLELRAIAAAYADPNLLKQRIISQNGLKAHRKIFDIILKSKNRKSEEFKTLRQALGFTFSLIAVVHSPNAFGVMKKLIELNDKDVDWIIKENMKKKRLINICPEKVKEIEILLNKRKG